MLKTEMTFSPLNSRQRRLRLLLAVFSVAILAGIYFWNPISQPLTVCKFHEITGVSCPTCGMSRSLQAAAHLHFWDSLKFHGSGWIAFFGLILFAGWTFSEGVLGKKISLQLTSKQKKMAFLILLAIWLISWVINIFRDLNVVRF